MIDFVRALGEFPIGSPNQMRGHARALQAMADQIQSTADEAMARVNAMVFQGPAANAFRSQFARAQRGVLNEAQHVRQWAADLAAAASRLEAQQNWWHRAAAKLEHDA